MGLTEQSYCSICHLLVRLLSLQFVSSDEFIIRRAYVNSTKPAGGKFSKLQYNMSVLPSVYPSDHPRDFCNFCICINFLCGGPVSRYISPHWGSEDTSRVQLILYVCFSVCFFVRLSASRFGVQNKWPVLRAAHASSGHGFKYLECGYNMSVHPSVQSSQAFIDFGICINFQCGGTASVSIYNINIKIKGNI